MTETLEIGRRTVVSVSDGEFPMPPQFLGAEAHRHLADADGSVRLPIGAFLLPGDEPLLIDAGLGPDAPEYEGLVAGRLLDGLSDLGVRPEDIRHLALSHLHADHIGWVATKDKGITFPNAQVYLGAADWRLFLDGDRGDSPEGPAPWTLAALRELDGRKQVTLLEGERELVPGVTAVPAPGHTPGHTVYVVQDGGDRAVVLGDAVYCPAQLSRLDWAAATEVDPSLAKRTRMWLADEFGDGRTVALGPHFPGLRAGRLVGGQWI
ncbi:MBL fold metallo-hydrolase [Streptomyces sp. MNU77]|uniref:MBL fold metallo-hydrolase n=1 Tax=Streptomyces sp. MNU77 TaxID=1573406 RepID=UPI0006990FB0|nr:MBL fold metallo-hydrolase [Streptomyces sp. MNU77]OLO25842.1 MBL fold metallo-hydrolase [Streptomyces sp. MNU77]